MRFAFPPCVVSFSGNTIRNHTVAFELSLVASRFTQEGSATVCASENQIRGRVIRSCAMYSFTNIYDNGALSYSCFVNVNRFRISSTNDHRLALRSRLSGA